MKNVIEQIKTKKSVRTFDGRALDKDTKEKLMSFLKEIENPFEIPVEFKFLDAKECNVNVAFVQTAPKMLASDMEYIASYKIL